MKATTGCFNFAHYLEQGIPKINSWLDHFLPSPNTVPQKLHEAMRYVIFPGGKRLRPVFALLSCEAFGVGEQQVRAAACSLELIHGYSLVHDDLPCMDDDDVRRGKPACHRAYDEATAVLVGDGLQALAFEVLAQTPNTKLIGPLTSILARAAGSQGMVGGQQLDLDFTGHTPQLNQVQSIHAQKTAALIAAAFEMGAVCAGVAQPLQQKIAILGRDVGLAFQIVDDILDATADAATLGKTPGKDAKDHKMTYPACVGLDASRRLAHEVAQRALVMLPNLGAPHPERFAAAIDFVVERVA